MQVTVENVSELGRRMTVTVEDANIEQTVNDRLNALRPNVKAAGFRPGKVPMKMVAQMHGASARNETIDGVIQNSMQEAFTQEKIQPASRPSIEEIKEEGESFIFVLSYEVFPDIKDVNMKGAKVEKVTAEVEDADVDNMLETLREQRATWETLKRGVKDGEQITVDFVGTIGGEAFQGGTGTDVAIEIGSGNMIPGFEDQLLGKKAGQETTVKVTFPEDYQAQELAGKEAEFAVTVKSVAKKKLPKLDKEFAVLCGVEAGLAALKKEVRANMGRELENALKQKNKKTIMDMLTEKNEVNLPEAPVQREAEHLMEQAKNNLKQQGVNIEGIPFTTDGFMDSAKQRVALSLLIGKIISDNEIQADEESVKAVIDLMASSYEDPEDVVNHYMNDPQKLSEVQMMVVEDMVVEHVLGQVKVEQTASTFSEVMNASNAA
jgi:trigger factor